MEKFNNIPISAKWSEIADSLNTNFSLAYVQFVQMATATTRSKGLFANLAVLNETYPSPNVGDWALVGNSIPAKVYLCEVRGVWHDTGTTGGGGSIELTNYATKTELNNYATKAEIATLNTKAEITITSDLVILTSHNSKTEPTPSDYGVVGADNHIVVNDTYTSLVYVDDNNVAVSDLTNID